MGLVSPLGGTVEENWENLRAGRTGVAYYPNELVPSAFHYLGKAGECPLPEPIAPGLLAQMKFLNRGSMLGLWAAWEAVRQTDALFRAAEPRRRALYIGSGDFTKSGHEFLYSAIQQSSEDGGLTLDVEKLNAATLAAVSPFFLLESIANNLFSFLSALLEIRGSNSSLASLSPCGAHALELATASIREGRADVALAVGCGNWITEIPLYELDGLGLLSKCKSGARSYRPFDRSRDGFIPGEGGAALVLASEESARRHGAASFGGIAGAANCIEFSEGLGVPSKVALRSASMALEDAGYEMKDLAFVCGHGSATRKGDHSELQSLLDLTGGGRLPVPICGLKPYTGHMGAASDIAEIILAIKGASEGIVPATPNFCQADDEFSGLKISERPQACAQERFLSISYGMGGQSSSIVISVE
jgi:3-oxoacyl-[acyl-carrier-protein] synthase II